MNHEILAPAGSFESLVAAVSAGANAVYLGFTDFSARAGAKNFDFSNFNEAVRYAYTRGVEIYIALNTVIVSKSELLKAMKIAEFALSCGVCNFIVQDLGLARLLKEASPEVVLHASTQTSLTTSMAANFLKPLGFKRYVLPRELNLGEIKEYSKNLDGESESFIHGAHCYCISGQCYLSAFCGGRSANRGSCAQPCRQPFSGDYPLSLSDLSFIDHKDNLTKAGVVSFKIEGRLKRAEYVAAAVDAVKEGKRTKILSDLFRRGEHTDGFLTDRRDSEMYGIRDKSDVALSNSAISKFSMPAEREIPIDIEVSLRSDIFTAKFSAENRSILAVGELPTAAKNKAVTDDIIRESLSKLGDTPFLLNSFKAEVEDGLFLSKSQINKLRRDGVDSLIQELLPPAIECETPEIIYKKRENRPHSLYGVFMRADMINRQIYDSFERIFLPTDEIKKLDSIFLDKANSLVSISFSDDKEIIGNTPLCEGVDGIAKALSFGKEPVADFSLNITNPESAKTLLNLDVNSLVISPECSANEAKFFPLEQKIGICGYGKLPVMKSRIPPKNKTDNSYLIDGMGERFLISQNLDISVIYNSRPIYLGDKKDALTFIDFYTLRFTDESRSEIEEVISLFNKSSPYPKQFSRAFHFKR